MVSGMGEVVSRTHNPGPSAWCAGLKALSRWPRSTAPPVSRAACAAALEVGVFDYRFVRRYLDVRYDNYGSAERPPRCKFPP